MTKRLLDRRLFGLMIVLTLVLVSCNWGTEKKIVSTSTQVVGDTVLMVNSPLDGTWRLDSILSRGVFTKSVKTSYLSFDCSRLYVSCSSDKDSSLQGVLRVVGTDSFQYVYVPIRRTVEHHQAKHHLSFINKFYYLNKANIDVNLTSCGINPVFIMDLEAITKYYITENNLFLWSPSRRNGLALSKQEL